ncbi:MAG: VCBS domain-containing protein, partial [Desulfovibrionaceae bacterium]|nr:VCBS domain-containing protein [Desulfovibrionaceae bacterium]
VREEDIAENKATSEGSFTIIAPDGVDTVVIAGVTVVEGGSLTDTSTITQNGGTLEITGYDADSGIISYTYTQNEPQTHDQPVHDESLINNFPVVVTDHDGSTNHETSIEVRIVDDVPTVNAATASIDEDATQPITGQVDFSYGADNGEGASITLNGDGQGTHGTITLDENGSYTYTLNNEDPAVQHLAPGESLTEEFSYTVTDADGDTKTETITITINGTDDGVTVTPAPKGAEDPTQPGQTTVDGMHITVREEDIAENKATSEGSFTITAPDGVDSVVIAGVTVVEGGSLTDILGSEKIFPLKWVSEGFLLRNVIQKVLSHSKERCFVISSFDFYPFCQILGATRDGAVFLFLKMRKTRYHRQKVSSTVV